MATWLGYYFKLAPLIALIDRWTLRSRAGCVDGCASNMRSAAAAFYRYPDHTCTISWVWFGSGTQAQLSVGERLISVREPSAGKTPARSMSGMLETELRNLDCGTATRKGRATVERNLRHRATSRLTCPARTGQDRRDLVQYGRSRSQRRAISRRHAPAPLARAPAAGVHVPRDPGAVVSFVLGRSRCSGFSRHCSSSSTGVPHFPFALMLGVSVGFRIDAGRLLCAAPVVRQ